MTSVNIRIDRELHKRAKVVCALSESTLSSFFIKAIKRKLKKDLRLLEVIE